MNLAHGCRCAAIALGAMAAGLFGLSSAALATPKAAAVVPAAPAASELDMLTRAFASGQLDAQSARACLGQWNCVVDTPRLLDALERSLRAMQQTAVLADGGNIEAAFQRGKMSLWIAGALEQQSRDMAAGGAIHQAMVVARRERAESGVAERYLGRAASQGHPAACLALAERLARQGSGGDALLVSRLFRCAVSGFMAAQALGEAQNALASMQRRVAASNVDLAEAHAIVYRLAVPAVPPGAR